jgi:nicotinate phosphoribosyltransferase
VAIDVIRDMGLQPPLAVRLDSGNLAELARAARELLDEAGLPEVRIVASGGLDDVDVERLVRAGAPIDGFGLGTRLGVSADAPFLDTVYKLVEYDGRPAAKLSPGKVSLPGRKQVFRGAFPGDDVVGLRDEEAPPGAAPLLERVMADGARIRPAEPLDEPRGRFLADLELLPEAARGLTEPVALRPRLSDALASLASRVEHELKLGRSGDEHGHHGV